MTSDAPFDRLQDYVDGVLSEEEARAVDALLKMDEAARKEVAFLRSLSQAARDLPEDLALERDLWCEIESEINRPDQSFRPWLRWASLAATAVVLMAVSSALTMFWMPQPSEAPVAVQRETPMPSPAMAALMTSEKTYSAAIDELWQILRDRRAELAPETVAVIERELKRIDDAIRVSKAALAADPNNPQSMHTILALQRKKVDLLEQAVNLPHGG